MLNPSILKIFAKSPIKPMQQHMELAYQSVTSLLPFFQSILSQDWQSAKIECDKINLLENKADNLKKEIRLHLPRKILLPMDRRDFIGLLKSQDQIANAAQRLVNLIFYRKMHFPEQIAKNLLNFVQLVINATNLAHNVINELDQLIETGFRGNEAQLVKNMIVELDRIDENTDDIQNNLQQELFNIEGHLNPIDAIFLYKVIDWTAELADKSKSVGHKLELLLSTK
ncbi:MAG: TIGR00153 family protein [Gammaproteobacteria bacterium]|jgi:predicted phosphate transport protein (TIGR00153 family)